MKWQIMRLSVVPYTTDPATDREKRFGVRAAIRTSPPDCATVTAAGVRLASTSSRPTGRNGLTPWPDVRSIWPRQQPAPISRPVATDLYLNFHAAALASPLEFPVQHYLVARASLSHYNAIVCFPCSTIDRGCDTRHRAPASASQ